MSEETTWIGGCLCRTCRYEFRGHPTHTGYCHCDMCKKATGGPFAVLVQASLEEFRWTKGRPRSYRSSPIATRGFCDLCGTPLYLQYDDDELIRVTAGSLDYPGQVRPTQHYGVESRLGWLTAAAACQKRKRKRRSEARSRPQVRRSNLDRLTLDYSCLPGRTELNTCRTVPRMTPS